LIGAAAAATHPLAGLPALLYLLLITVRNKKMFYTCAALGSISLPTVFLINAAMNKLNVSLSLTNLSPIKLIESLKINLIFQSGYNTLLDFAYLYEANLLIIFVLITMLVLWLERKNKNIRLIATPAIMSIILLINYAVMKSAINFTFLIDYERSNYADRLILLIFFFLTPYVAMLISRLWNKIHEADILQKVFVLFILVATMTSQVYLAYPRRDNYDTSHGFNTGEADFLAVKYINENAPSDYVVLANQQVASAAVFEYGFKTYYGDVFYYPIPTGGELYQKFLEMNERPSREIMQEAMSLADVNAAYYVVNDYWWQSERLIETAKTNSDGWVAIDNGRVHVFRYNHVELK
jgi:hypothetical protein